MRPGGLADVPRLSSILGGVRRLVVITVAFLLSVLAAGGTFTLIAAFPVMLEQSIADALGGLALMTILVGAAAGMILALPVVLAIAVTEWRGWRSLPLHLATGTVFGASAALYWEIRREAPMEFHVILAGAIAGTAGAFTYWRIAGRTAGRFNGSPARSGS